MPTFVQGLLLSLKLFQSGTLPQNTASSFEKQDYKSHVGLNQKLVEAQKLHMFLETSDSCPKYAAGLHFTTSPD